MSLIEHDEGKIKAFIASLETKEKMTFMRMKNKFRGAFGFRERVIYVPRRRQAVYEVFPKAHEITHGSLEWHNTSFLDNNMTLKPEFKDIIEREANFGAGEIIFQGDSFKDRVMGYHESLDAALALAEECGATAASTFWRYAQVHDRPVAILVYSATTMQLMRAVASSSFRRQWASTLVPDCLNEEHEWNQSPPGRATQEGDSHLTCAGGRYKVEWQSWQNRYTTSVLLKAPSRLHAVGNLLREFKSLVGS